MEAGLPFGKLFFEKMNSGNIAHKSTQNENDHPVDFQRGP